MKITETPPPPTQEEKAQFFHGRSDGQHARKHKKTGEVELWWTGGDGHWAPYATSYPTKFVCKPRLT
jgi:hypothetical protein